MIVRQCTLPPEEALESGGEEAGPSRRTGGGGGEDGGGVLGGSWNTTNCKFNPLPTIGNSLKKKACTKY